MDTTMEPKGTALLQEAPLRELISARVISRAVAVGSPGGFVLEVHFGERKALLASSRGGARTFASLTTIALLMQRIGQAHFEVDASRFRPGRVRPPQPERSAAMRAGKLPKAPRKAKATVSATETEITDVGSRSLNSFKKKTRRGIDD